MACTFVDMLYAMNHYSACVTHYIGKCHLFVEYCALLSHTEKTMPKCQCHPGLHNSHKGGGYFLSGSPKAAHICLKLTRER